MTRRRVPSDPTGNLATRASADDIRRFLEARVSERDARILLFAYGVTTGYVPTRTERADFEGVSGTRADFLLARALTRLRDSAGPWEHENAEEILALFDNIRPATSAYAADSTAACLHCGRPFPRWSPAQRRGRPRIYDTAACKQAAYRARRSARAESEADTGK